MKTKVKIRGEVCEDAYLDELNKVLTSLGKYVMNLRRCYLYWGNDLGWVDFDSATEFFLDEIRYFPIGSTGVEFLR